MNYNNNEDLIKIVLLFILLIIIIYVNNNKVYNNFTNTNDLKNLILSMNTKNLRYNYKYDTIKIDNYSKEIAKIAMNDNLLYKIIKQKTVEIYQEILINNEIREFLMFNNLIHLDGFPLFIKESEQVLLINEIKILLLLMPQDKFNKIKY